MNRPSAVIIGAGLGGLFTGAILAREGFRVTVIEKNATIGGGLQTFRRFGETFDTGMHVVGGLHANGNIRMICRYLGIEDQLHIRFVDDDCTDSLFFAEDHSRYNIAKGKEGFVNALADCFPSERDALHSYVNDIFAMTDQVNLFNLRPSTGNLSLLTANADFLMAADSFIAQHVSDERLRSILAYMNPLYGGRAGQTPAYVHAIISKLYISGAARFQGGSSHLATLLEQLITNAGGSVLTADAVTHIATTNRHVDYVVTSQGRTFKADYYISAIHPCTMLRLLDADALPRAYRQRLDRIPNAHSAFLLFVKLKEGMFPYINHSDYYMTRYADVWQCSSPSTSWPLGFLFMTPPETDQGPFSSKAILTAPMPFEYVERWTDTSVGHRGADYDAWKHEHACMLLEKMEDIYPGFNRCVEQWEAASPLTIRDYYGVKEGSICGFSKDCRNMALSQVPVVTKIDNLLLTGQNCNLHGFCGVPLTAINTCEAILGRNYVINHINHSCHRE